MDIAKIKEESSPEFYRPREKKSPTLKKPSESRVPLLSAAYLVVNKMKTLFINNQTGT